MTHPTPDLTAWILARLDAIEGFLVIDPPPEGMQSDAGTGDMIPSRFNIMKPKRGGWTEWIYPDKKYYLKCCDCGLVHEMEFKAFAETRQKRGGFEVAVLPWPIRAMFRARRVTTKGQGAHPSS